MREILRHVAIGLGNNASVGVQPLCVYVRGMLVTHLPPKPGAPEPRPAAGHPPRHVPLEKDD